MNVLFISRNSPFESVGGIERYLTNLIANYDNIKNSDARIFIMLPSSKNSYVKKTKRVTIYYDQSLFLSRSVLATQKEVSKKAQDFSQNLDQILIKNNINIICAENFHTDLPAAYSLALNMISTSKKIPLILQVHSFASTELQMELVSQLKWDKISCVSKSVAGDCFQKGLDIEQLSTHYLGVNTNDFNTNISEGFDLKKRLALGESDKILLTATRIIRGKRNILQEKGLINLIQAFSKLAPRYSNLKLLIAIGSPPYNLNEEFKTAYEMLKGYIRLHNVENQTILKMFKLDEMPSVYRGSEVFILPSENETFGQVFIEAMSCGIPVIGTKVGGIPEIISDSYNGFLIASGDSSILAQKIEKLINNESIRRRFIKAGHSTVNKDFTSTKQFLEFHKMLQDTVLE
jgi:glycosyltransferase involved in cell wall biosynthesis